MRGAQREDLRGAEASRCAGQQHVRVRDQQIRQRIQRRRRVADVQLAGLGQRGDPVAVAVQAEGARRARHTQHAGVVGYVGVHPFGEVVQQRVVAARGQHAGDHACIGRVQRRVDRLEVVEFRLVVEQQQRLGAEQRDTGRRRARPAPAPCHKAGARRQRDQQQRHQEERMHHEHRGQHERRAGTRAGQVIAVDLADAVGIQHEAQADEHAGQKEERQQARVIAGDVPELRLPGHRVLQLQRVERVCGGEVEADRRRRHQQRRERRQQRLAVARERVAEQRQQHAAEREPHHHDGDHPVAILGPFRDREVAGECGLVSHCGQRHEEQRHQTGARRHGHTVRVMKPASSALNRAASSTNSAWPASPNIAICVPGRLCARFAACSDSQPGRTT